MKTTKILSLAFLTFITLSSCNKNYQCICTANDGSGSGKDIEFQAKNKSDAEATCLAEEAMSYGSTYSCALQ